MNLENKPTKVEERGVVIDGEFEINLYTLCI